MYKMETYYYALVSHTGRFLTVQMIWWSGFHKLSGAVYYAKQ